MISTLPSVQFNCKKARSQVCYSPRARRSDKRIANRRHRHHLNMKSRRFIKEPWLFDDEPFAAPSLSSWDISLYTAHLQYTLYCG